MVALDISEAQNLAVTNNENGLKKSKKKKNKHPDSSDPTVITEKKSKNEKGDKKKHKKDSENIENAPENREDSQVKNNDEIDKEKRRKKKEAKKLKKKLEREMNEKEETTNKRKHETESDKNMDTKDETSEPEKKKPKESKDETNDSPKQHKKKKNKKEKKEKLNQDCVTSPKENDVEMEENSMNGQVKTVGNLNSCTVENDIPKKKKKKDKKEKSHSKNEATEANMNGDNFESVQDNTSQDDGPFKRDFYSASYSSLTLNKEEETEKAEKYRSEQRITVYGKGKKDGQFYPIRDFKRLGFEDKLMSIVKNFKEPTPIQASVWPIIASGRDCIGIAETGSGKTLAFSIPALAHLNHRLTLEKQNKKVKRRGPMMLIVAPTRELAQQSQDVLEEAGKSCGIRSVSVYGGVSKDWQRKALNAKGTSPYEIVVATPGKNLLFISKTLQIFLLNHPNYE